MSRNRMSKRRPWARDYRYADVLMAFEDPI
jgi:hypothetical protein